MREKKKFEINEIEKPEQNETYYIILITNTKKKRNSTT